MRYYILTHQGEIKKVDEVFTKEPHILMAKKKRHLKKSLNWYLKNGFTFKLIEIKEETE